MPVAGLEALSPEAAFDMVRLAAQRLELMSDPLAFASLSWIEQQLDQGPRITGVGGEFARGNYYFGPSLRLPVTRSITGVLARWRLFAHESAAAEMLHPTFREWANAFTIADLHEILSSFDRDWLAATDEFYLEYMRRWAGVSTTAVALERQVLQPLLDRRFIAIVRGLSPADKSGNRFVSRLQIALDPALAEIPLEGRLAPAVYARSSAANLARRTGWAAGRVADKVQRQLRREQRGHVGAPVLAGKVVEYWRAHPDALADVRHLGIVRCEWVDDLLAGRVEAGTGTVALLMNLSAATASDLVC